MEDRKGNKNRMMLSLYLVMIGIMAFIVVYLIANCDVPDRNKLAYEQFDRDIVWYDENDQIVQEPKHLYELGPDNHSIYTVLPEELPENVGLCFRNRHVLFSAYVGDECVFQQELPESRFYTNSVGSNWVMIPLKQAYAGERLYIDYKLCYEEHGVGFDRIAIGSEVNYLIELIREKAFSFFLPMTYLIIGFVLILIDILLFEFLRNKHHFFYLGCFAIGAAFYCLAETQLFPIFIPDQKIMHLIPMFSMAMIPIPSVAYANSVFGFKYKSTAPMMVIASFMAFLFLTVLNFFDILDYHELMYVFQICFWSALP